MSWFRRLFSRKKRLEKIEIPLDKLDSWLDSRAELLKGKLKQQLINYTDVYNAEVADIEKNLKALETAELKNKNVLPKVKSIMEGNRNTYVRFVRSFVDRHAVPDFEKIDEFIKVFEEDIEGLNKTTGKAFYVLQEFFKDEVNRIAANIKRMDAAVANMKKELVKSDYDKILELKDNIIRLNEKLKLKNEIKEESEKVKKENDEINKKIDTTERFIDDLKRSAEYEEMQKLKSKLEDTDRKITDHKNMLFQYFSAIERPLKKYKHMTYDYDKIVEGYLDNPVNALVKDQRMDIISVLYSIKKLLQSGELGLKDASLNKTIEIVDKLDKKYLQEYLLVYNRLKQEREIILAEINKNTIDEKLAELNKKLEVAKYQKERSDAQLNNLKQKMNRFNIDQIKKDLKKSLEITGFDVRIID